ncbi:segregation and condensation protein A [Alteromonas lipolytica]|uniref:Segregation and condensation protein A n=1 Tax=Alteromonas lipolytica TaxID=1856405 RepID=A0A1E8FEG2_9ALTE|nr:ScpA family protein [Alteromonas lipolytica]OFI34337.1 segregation and condensation protein A [Alteromonas lipolytica]GGF82359.1 segregation and condensation protein A [Alteromonas lipolytica]
MSNSDENQSTLSTPVQQPLPLAFVNGEAVIEKPEDLYIPPEALEVILESFEGPLDLLLYLIRKQKFDITTMPVAEITRQYMEYVGVMQTLKLELAAEYLLMAAILAEIKSRLLLPSRSDDEDDEEDPRAALIRRLQEYELIKQAAEDLDLQPRMERDLYKVNVDPSAEVKPVIIQPDVSLQELVIAFSAAMQRAAAFEHHHIAPEALSTRERMSKILQMLTREEFTPMEALFTAEEGRAGAVVTFLAILELVKGQTIRLVQAGPFARIHVKLGSFEDHEEN